MRKWIISILLVAGLAVIVSVHAFAATPVVDTVNVVDVSDMDLSGFEMMGGGGVGGAVGGGGGGAVGGGGANIDVAQY